MTSSETIEQARVRFWDLADPMIGQGLADRGTMMGSDCLRVGGEFAAMAHSKTGQLIVKLPAERVLELAASGTGDTFAPNGRVFKEWLAANGTDDEIWRVMITEALEFAANATK